MTAPPAAPVPAPRWPAWPRTGGLKPGQPWRQEGILGTVFEGSCRSDNSETETTAYPAGVKKIIPTITGSAYVTAECTLIFDPADPFRLGVPE